MTDDGFIDFKCPHCGGDVAFPAEFAGLAQECPTCTGTVMVPAGGGRAAQPLPLPWSTARLELRRLRMEDWKDLFAYLADEEASRPTESRPLNEEEILHWLESDQHVKLTTPGQPFHLGIELKADRKLVGHLTLQFQEPQRQQAAMSILLNRRFQRQGFATEAAAGALAFCFAALQLHRVTAACDRANTGGCKLAGRLGLRREGEFLKDHLLDGQWSDTLAYAMLAEEYQAAVAGKPPSAAA